MLETTNDPKERIALLEQEIGNIVGTFYFQALLADYEYQAHKLAESGEPITAEVLSKIMEDLFDKYYGDIIEKDDLIYIFWARVPHFFNSPFYVLTIYVFFYIFIIQYFEFRCKLFYISIPFYNLLISTSNLSNSKSNCFATASIVSIFDKSTPAFLSCSIGKSFPPELNN